MPEETKTLDTWGIVEVMGHKSFAGHITEQAFGVAALLRVDVPETDQGNLTTKPYTKFIGVGSIYCLTPTSEDVARRAAQVIERINEPIPVTLPAARQIAAPAHLETDADFDEDDEYEPDFDPDH